MLLLQSIISYLVGAWNAKYTSPQPQFEIIQTHVCTLLAFSFEITLSMLIYSAPPLQGPVNHLLAISMRQVTPETNSLLSPHLKEIMAPEIHIPRVDSFPRKLNL